MATATMTKPRSKATASGGATTKAAATAPPKWAMTAARQCAKAFGLDAEEHLDATTKAARAIARAARDAAARGTLTPPD